MDSTFIVAIIQAGIVGLLVHFDNRNKKRGAARDELNGLILTGFDAMGNLALKAALKALDRACDQDVDRAINEYNTFRDAVKKFTKDQAKSAVSI